MYIVPIIAILVSICLVLYCALAYTLLYDKILAVNVLGTVMVLFIAVHGFFRGRPEFLDIALVYAMINFITTVAILKFFEYRDMARGADEGNEI